MWWHSMFPKLPDPPVGEHCNYNHTVCLVGDQTNCLVVVTSWSWHPDPDVGLSQWISVLPLAFWHTWSPRSCWIQWEVKQEHILLLRKAFYADVCESFNVVIQSIGIYIFLDCSVDCVLGQSRCFFISFIWLLRSLLVMNWKFDSIECRLVLSCLHFWIRLSTGSRPDWSS